jgi:hypothetical protein
MYSRPRTINQRRENRDDAAADASQDRIDPDWEAYRNHRDELLNLGYCPDDVEIMMLEWESQRKEERKFKL